jgi:hypothetical protein
MPLLLIPIDSLSEQLLARRTGADDYSIHVEAGEHGRLPVGRIMRVARASGRTAFFWTVTGPAVPDAGIALAGEEADLDVAKVAFRQAFDRLLYWAAEHKSGLLPWHGMDKVQG